MTFDREPDLDNANVGMPDIDARGIGRNIEFTEAIQRMASVFVFQKGCDLCDPDGDSGGWKGSALYLVFCDGNPCFGVRGEKRFSTE